MSGAGPGHARAMTTPVLLVTRDDALLDDLLRLAAAAGVSLDVAPDAEAALPGWAAAAVVLVGADQAALVARQRPPRHGQAYVVARGAAGDPLFRDALVLGARAVVELPMADTWLVEVLADALDGAGAAARTIAVVPGSGGAGASTFAGALALVAATTVPTLLLDLDPWGAGADRVVGCDESAGIRWDALMTPSGRLGSRSLRAALPGRGRLAVLTWSAHDVVALEPGAVREVLSAAQRGSEVVVVDLPRSLYGVPADVVGRCDEVALVVEATVPGVAAAGKVADRLRTLGPDPFLVVRTSGGALTADAVGEALGLPLLAEYPSRRRVAEQVDLGVGPLGSRRTPLARAARGVLAGAVPMPGRTS